MLILNHTYNKEERYIYDCMKLRKLRSLVIKLINLCLLYKIKSFFLKDAGPCWRLAICWTGFCISSGFKATIYTTNDESGSIQYMCYSQGNQFEAKEPSPFWPQFQCFNGFKSCGFQIPGQCISYLYSIRKSKRVYCADKLSNVFSLQYIYLNRGSYVSQSVSLVAG